MRFPLDMQAPYLCPSVLIIYLFFVLSQIFAVDVDDSLECKICSGYQICGRKQFQMPECFNGVPCTKKQYVLCKKMTASTQTEDCDRPGKFPDSKSPNKFYTCNINGSNFEKLEETCPSHTTFDSKTKHCLTADEKTMLTIVENYDSRTTGDETKFHCTGFGTFPDPHDCKMYHSCNEKFESEDFYCSHGMYFNGVNCTTTKYPECMNQLKEKSSNEIKQGEEVYKRVQKFLENDTQKNNSIVFKPFESSAENKLTIYVGEEKPEVVTNAREDVTNYHEKFEIEKQAESKYRLSAIRKLRQNTKNMALKTIITAKIMEETVNDKICGEEDAVEEGTLKLKFSVFNTVNFAIIECNNHNNETKLNPHLTSKQMQTTLSEVIATDHREETNNEHEITTDATTVHQAVSLELKTNTSAEYSTAVTQSNSEITTNVNDVTNNLGDTTNSTFVIPSDNGMTMNYKKETEPITTYTEPITSGYDEHTSASKYKSIKTTTFDSETTSSVINDTNMTPVIGTEASIVMENPEQQTKFTASQTQTTAVDKENTFTPKRNATTTGSIKTHFAVNEEENLNPTDEKTTSSFQTKPSVIEPYSNNSFYIYSQQNGKTSMEYEPAFTHSHSETTYFYTQNKNDTYDGKTTAGLKNIFTTADSYREFPFQDQFGLDHEDNETSELKHTATVLLTETSADISIDEEYNETNEGSSNIFSKYKPTNANSNTKLQTTLQEHETLTTVNNVADEATALSSLKLELTNKEPTVEIHTDEDATVSSFEHKPTTTGFYITHISPSEEAFNGKTKHEITTEEYNHETKLRVQNIDDLQILNNNTQNKQSTEYNSEPPYKTELPTVIPATIYKTFSVGDPSTYPVSYSNNKSDVYAADETAAFFGHNRTITEYSEVTSSEITRTEKTSESLMKEKSTQQSEKTNSYHYFTTFANEKQTDTPSYTEVFSEKEKASPNYTPIQQEIYSDGKTDSLNKTTVAPFEKETTSPILQEEKTKFEANTKTPKISTDYSTTQEESLNDKQKISSLEHKILVDGKTTPSTTHSGITTYVTFTEKQNISTEYSLPEDSYSKRGTMDSSKLTPPTIFDENTEYITNAGKPNISEENTTTASEPYSCVTSDVKVTSPSYIAVQPESHNSVETISPYQSSIPHNTPLSVTNNDKKITNPEDIITATASYAESTTVRDENTPVLKQEPIKIPISDEEAAFIIPEDENTTYPTYVTKPNIFFDSSTTQEQPYSNKEATIPSAIDQTNPINLKYKETPNIFTVDYTIDTKSYSDRETYETKYAPPRDKTNISTTHTESYSERETQTESYDNIETISSSKITMTIHDNKTTSHVDVQTDRPTIFRHATDVHISGEPLSSSPTATETNSGASEVHDLYESKGTSEEQKSTFPVTYNKATPNTDVYKYYEDKIFNSTQMLTTPEILPESSSVSDEMVDGKKFPGNKTVVVKTTPTVEVYAEYNETETVDATYGKTVSSEVFSETAVDITDIQDQETIEGCNGEHLFDDDNKDLGNSALQPQEQLTTEELPALFTSASSYLSETEESYSRETSIALTTEIPDYTNGSTVYLTQQFTRLPESTPKIKQIGQRDKTSGLKTTSPAAIKTKNSTKFTTASTISITMPHQVSLTLTSANHVQKFRCLRAGYFEDPNDCHSYYHCIVVYTNRTRCPKCREKRLKLVPFHYTCNNGKWFSTFFVRCITYKPLRCYF